MNPAVNIAENISTPSQGTISPFARDEISVKTWLKTASWVSFGPPLQFSFKPSYPLNTKRIKSTARCVRDYYVIVFCFCLKSALIHSTNKSF